MPVSPIHDRDLSVPGDMQEERIESDIGWTTGRGTIPLSGVRAAAVAAAAILAYLAIVARRLVRRTPMAHASHPAQQAMGLTDPES